MKRGEVLRLCKQTPHFLYYNFRNQIFYKRFHKGVAFTAKLAFCDFKIEMWRNCKPLQASLQFLTLYYIYNFIATF